MQLQDDDEDIPLTMNVVPMIDVVFALLTFFMISTLYLTRLQGLPVSLPQTNTGKVQTQTEITVTIDKNGKLAVNREFMDLQSLSAKVKSMVGKKNQVLVVINADQEVNHGKVVAVMDNLRLITGVRLAIATQP
jgi:biopolymer transport protein ExbD